MQGYQRYIYMGIIIIALGITMSTTMADSVGAIGTVMIAIGGLFIDCYHSLVDARGELSVLVCVCHP